MKTKYLLITVAFVLTACVAPSGDEIVVMTKEQYDKDIRGAVLAGEYSVCYRAFPIAECRNNYNERFSVAGGTNPMSPEARAQHTDAVMPFIDALYDDIDGLNFEPWEQWLLDSTNN